MASCTNCGSQLIEGANFCTDCGAADSQDAFAWGQTASVTKAFSKKKPIYKKWWFWVLAAPVAAVIAFTFMIAKDVSDAFVPREFIYENYKKVETRFRDAGFQNIELVIFETSDEWNDNKVNEVTINGKPVNNLAEAKAFSKKAKVSIFYCSFVASATRAETSTVDNSEDEAGTTTGPASMTTAVTTHAAVSVSYEQLARNPKNYEGQTVMFSGQVYAVMDGFYVMFVDGDFNESLYVSYDDAGNRALMGDWVTVTGRSTGIKEFFSYPSLQETSRKVIPEASGEPEGSGNRPYNVQNEVIIQYGANNTIIS